MYKPLFSSVLYLLLDALYELNGFQVGYIAGGRYEKKRFLKKLLGFLKKKEKVTKTHVRCVSNIFRSMGVRRS